MSEPKWTPGPWRYNAEDGIVEDANGKPLLSAIPTGTPYQRKYNGQVTSAAAELYEALKEQLEWTATGPCQLPMRDPCRCAACKSYRANAALAKARGEA